MVQTPSSAFLRFTDDYLAVVPEFQPIVDRHRAENDEVLQYVLFAEDIGAFLAEQNSESITHRTMDFMEAQLVGGDQDVADLVVLAFMWDLDIDRRERAGKFWDAATPRLKEAWRAYERNS